LSLNKDTSLKRKKDQLILNVDLSVVWCGCDGYKSAILRPQLRMRSAIWKPWVI